MAGRQSHGTGGHIGDSRPDGKRKRPTQKSRLAALGKDGSAILKHPLTLAILAGLLIPSFTRSWQDHQKELELQTGIATATADSVAKMVTAVQVFGQRCGGSVQSCLGNTRSRADLDKSYTEWIQNQEVLRAQLEAYFESRSVMAEWNRYSNAVTEFYDITACRPPSMSESSASKKIEVMRRSRRLKDVLSTVIQVAEGQNARGAYRRDMAALAECALPLSGTPVYEQAWFDVRNRILDHNDKLVQIIFKSPIPAYTNIWDRITDVWDRVTNL